MAKIDGNSRKERVRMLVGGNSKRRAKREGAGNKRNILPTTPLLMQLLGILHLSAVCARAAAVVGVVLSPSTTTSECSRATVVSSSPGKSMAMPSHGVVTTAITNERPPAAIVCRNVSCNRMRPRGKAPTSVNVTVSPLDKRRMALFRARFEPLISKTAFLSPANFSTRHRHHHHRHRYFVSSRRRIYSLSKILPQRASFGIATIPSRKRPLTMLFSLAPQAAVATGAAVVATVAAVLAAVNRLKVSSSENCSGFDIERSHNFSENASADEDTRSKEENLVDKSNNESSCSSNSRSSSSNRTRGSVKNPRTIQLVLSSFMRQLFPGISVGARPKRQPTAGSSVPQKKPRGGNGGARQGFFNWMWPFAPAVGLASAPEGKGVGYRQTSEANAPRAMLKPPGSERAQYARPQSTAYPRPQSTAYPRPKVTISTLLELDAKDADEELLSSDQRAAESGGDEDENPLLTKFLCWFFERVITSRAKLVEGLEVSVDARSNRDAMSGLLQAVEITFNHLRLKNIVISGGATLKITGLDLKVRTLIWRRFQSFKKPFEVAGSFVFTSADLASSPMVRRIVENMMNATMRKLEIMAADSLALSKSMVSIRQVTSERSRLVVDGDMTYENVQVPFTYRTSIGTRQEGHVVFLKDPEVFWENVSGSLSLPLLPLTAFDIDVGDTARIESIRIVNGKVALKTRFVLSPFPPLVVASLLKRGTFRFDLGERLSVAFGNFVQNMRII